MSFKKYLLSVSTAWCGEDQTYGIIKKEETDVEGLCEDLAYTNFSDFSGIDGVLEDMFPNQEEYTDEQIEKAENEAGNYYQWNLEEFEEDGETDFNWFELVYDESAKTE